MNPGDHLKLTHKIGEELTNVQSFILHAIHDQETSIISQVIESVEGLGEDDDDQEDLEQGIEDDACRELGILEGTFKSKAIYGIRKDGSAGTYSHSTFVYIDQLPGDLILVKEWTEGDEPISAFSNQLEDDLYNCGFAILAHIEGALTLESKFQFIALKSQSQPELSNLWFPKELFQV